MFDITGSNKKIQLFVVFLLSHGFWTKHSLWREGLYQPLWGVRQGRRASTENSRQTKEAKITQHFSELRSRVSRALSWHRSWWGRILSQYGGYFQDQNLTILPYWSQWFTIPFLHRPQCKVRSTAALNAQTKVGVWPQRCQESRQ